MRALATLSIAAVTAGCLSACGPAVPRPAGLCDAGRIAEERAAIQPTSPEPPAPEDPAARLDAAADAALERADSVEVAQDYWYCRELEAAARYRIAAFDRRGAAFAWHHAASVLIFAVVLLIVCLGFLFAGMQFRQSLRVQVPLAPTAPRSAAAAAQDTEGSPPPPPDPPAADPGSAKDHEFELSLQTIKLRSSALGLVIWVVSIAFFYLYLRYVYPLHEEIAEERSPAVEPAEESP